MGAGKSTVGRQLAKVLKRSFYDSDREIEKRTGVSISWIFEMEGEQGFREREKKVIAELTCLKNIVLATGGGAILADENRRALRAQGHVVYLAASEEQLLKRTSKDKNRPLLQTEDPKKKIIELLEKRDPLYQNVADVVLRTGEQSIQHTVSMVIKQLEELGK
ncbi:shikimate kinase [Methylophaga sp. 42_8_T64]|nr:shikimate kinase [Methylophaga sp. 41_12_T18]OUR86237.1 shikimate kinase [Methylophaga sp. 42_8_T64]